MHFFSKNLSKLSVYQKSVILRYQRGTDQHDGQQKRDKNTNNGDATQGMKIQTIVTQHKG